LLIIKATKVSKKYVWYISMVFSRSSHPLVLCSTPCYLSWLYYSIHHPSPCRKLCDYSYVSFYLLRFKWHDGDRTCLDCWTGAHGSRGEREREHICYFSRFSGPVCDSSPGLVTRGARHLAPLVLCTFVWSAARSQRPKFVDLDIYT
jgi:hypothetical protein